MLRCLLVLAATLALLGVVAPAAEAQPADVTRLAIIGDSITTGYGVAPGQSYADLLEADDPGDNILPLAHNGATLRLWLTTYLPELTTQLDTWQPTTVLIAVGGNDWYGGRRTADWQTDLTYLIWQVRAHAPYGVRVIVWHYYPFGIGQNTTACDVWPCTPASSTWGQYNTATAQTVAANYGGYVDTSATTPELQADHVHPSVLGHQQTHSLIRSRLLSF